MAEDSSILSHLTTKIVPISSAENVLLEQLGRSLSPRKYIKRTNLKELAVEKAKEGITWKDLRDKFSCSKGEAQRKLKYFHSKGVLFTAQDLIYQGLDLPTTFRNRKPQRYYAGSIKAELIEKIKTELKNVPVHPTGVAHSSISPLSDTVEYQKARSFLDILTQLPFAFLHIHRLQLMLSLDKEYYTGLKQEPCRKNKAKLYEEIIGTRHVSYTFSPNGTVLISVVSSDNPFRLETDEDVSALFAFFGQVKDRLLYHVSDLRERIVPNIMEWHLKGCDINKDIEIDNNMQLTLPDIQLKHADRVFRLYVKPSGDKAFYRIEESLSPSLILPQALDTIRNPNKAMNEILLAAINQMNMKIDSLPHCNCKNSQADSKDDGSSIVSDC
jgi:hypothetical protein